MTPTAERDTDIALRITMIRWSLCALACAGGSAGLAWLVPAAPLRNPFGGAALLLALIVLPLTSVLVPLLWLRRIPLRQRKVAWQFIVPVVVGVALGVIGKQAGDQAGLADRGQWTEAVVVHKEEGKTDRCLVRASGGPAIWPSLSEGDGCRKSVSEGATLRIRYDPEGVARPVEDVDTASYGELLAYLLVAAVAMGTWGGVRQSRWDREYEATGGRV
ncbi:hypothetical protein PV396_35980 [Streptomyces sp. ME02-8801-2C]|uniref:hypothetical protein n=1 Tax=Streptomyces sp. ME02-8801-2C TaxID=3028680 RepID=UPI0029BAA6D7|nr:hypothetical protein [Streptomyces sp. ME02-8801-2C]MDX3457296.1 hypothetical protein [Streptomyces sp. ME02-8801-2C]